MAFRLGEIVSLPGRWSCWRKERRRSRGAAEAQLRSLLRNPRVSEGDKRRLRAYRCRACGWWHVGRRKEHDGG